MILAEATKLDSLSFDGIAGAIIMAGYTSGCPHQSIAFVVCRQGFVVKSKP
ncbi:MAG: hypothetical protein JXA73_08095 [Acidobacteria bacterium]|nr:hypothetical protein [Acidobacteriota bacterium]